MNVIVFILFLIVPLFLGFVGFVLYGLFNTCAALIVLSVGLARRLLTFSYKKHS